MLILPAIASNIYYIYTIALNCLISHTNYLKLFLKICTGPDVLWLAFLLEVAAYSVMESWQMLTSYSLYTLKLCPARLNKQYLPGHTCLKVSEAYNWHFVTYVDRVINAIEVE